MRRAALTAALALTIAAPVSATTLRGTVIDAFTELPVANARVAVEPSGPSTYTDASGRYVLDSEAEPATLSVTCGACREGLTFVRQTEARDATLRVIPAGGTPQAGAWWGLPASDRGPTVPDLSLRLSDLLPVSPLLSVLPEALPESIRVGRRFSDTCVGHDVTRIDEVPLEEYVQGVLLPEIGVFRSIDGGPESSRAVFEAFAVAARSYALWFYLRDPDAPWHIDDTACNQRYDDARSAFVAEAVAQTESTVLVARSDIDLLDKLEYAASCGRYGSLPEYQTTTVPDVTGTEACVGSWCGHNNCAGHETNPAVPGEGRCLVRGICQWGAAERSMRGDTFEQILAHYQPNLTLRRIGPPTGTASVFGVVLDGTSSPATPLQGATVSAEGTALATTDALGRYELIEIAEGSVRVSAAAPGFVAEVASVTLAADARVEVSFVLDPDTSGDPDAGGWGDSGLPDTGPADTGPDDTGPDDTGLPDAGTPDATIDAASDDTASDDASVDLDADATSPSGDGGDSDTASDPDGALPRMTSVVGPEGLGASCSASPRGCGPLWMGCVVSALVAVRRSRRIRWP